MRALALVVVVAAVGCAPAVVTYERGAVTIHHFDVGIANVWAVETSTGLALVDLSTKNDGDKILQALTEINKKPDDVTLVFMTHGHLDHLGPAAQLQKVIHAPFALGRADLHFATSGESVPPADQNLEGTVARPFLDTHYPAFTPDLLLDGGERLDDFGIPGQIVSVPGHTKGSMALVLDTHDAFVGDIVRGVDEGDAHEPDGSDQGHEGRAATHLYSEDVGADALHLAGILNLGAARIYPGHGPWFDSASARGWATDHITP